MKKTFSEYQPYKEDDIAGLWNNACFVFDTSVVLNLYRYSKQTSEMFVSVISDLNGRIWLPYQVGREFYKNRLTVISEQKKQYTLFQTSIKSIIAEVENKNKNPFFSETLTDKIITIGTDVDEELQRIIQDYEKWSSSDPLLEKINIIFEEKIGEEYKTEKISEIHTNGAKRYINKIPPGYLDNKKHQNDKYGDLIIWNQVIDKASSTKSDIIFILDDRKEDWWLKHEGKIISPRPELLKEFREKTSQRIHFYRPFQFLEHSNTYLKKTVQREIIEEVKNYIEDNLKNDSSSHIELLLQGKQKNLDTLFNAMKDAGYNVASDTDETKDLHHLYITLPDIPDLERRLNSKYISNLGSYGLTLCSDPSTEI